MKCPIKYSTAEIISISEVGGDELKDMIKHILSTLCKCSAFVGMVFKHVKHRKGNLEDGKDLLQDGLAQLAVSLASKKFKGGSSIENYAFGICKNIWLNKSQKHDRTKVTLVGEDVRKDAVAPENTETNLLNLERNTMLWKIVKQLTGRCPKLLELWALSYSHKEIASQMNITEKRSRKATSECREKLRNLIRQHPNYQDLKRLEA